MSARVGLLLLSITSAAACVDNPYAPLDPNIDPITTGDWYRPTPTTTWQWQLQVREGEAALNTSYDVDVYDIDLFDVGPEQIAALQDQGRRVICYFSAGSWEQWRDDAELFDKADLGAKLDGWAGERWLNIRSPKVMDVMLTRLDLAVQRGCDGVEPDNVDGYTNHSGFELVPDDQLAFNRALANAAHTRGLSIGLKNAGDQAAALVEYFDFSLNEQCHAYDECAQLQPFTAAGKPIWNAEYVEPDTLASAQATAADLCPRAQDEQIRALVLPLELDDSFRVSCD